MATETYKGYTIKIETDDSPMSPREFDNLGTIVCDHRRHSLPWEFDGMSQKNPTYFYRTNDPWTGEFYYEEADCQSWDDVILGVEQRLRQAGDEIAVVLPLYAYDHSCFDISTQIERYWFHAAWDSGQIGFIFISRNKVREEYGWKHITSARRAKLTEYLKAEVKEFSQYVNGDVWYYSIEDEDGNLYDSCGGYFGYDVCLEQAKEAVGV